MELCRTRHMVVMNRHRQLVGLVSIDSLRENLDSNIKQSELTDNKLCKPYTAHWL